MLVTQIAIFFQRLMDNSVQLLGQLRIRFPDRPSRSVQNSLEDHRMGVAIEWTVARRHLVQHYAKAEEVRACIQILAARLLRTHVRSRTDRRARTGQMLGL